MDIFASDIGIDLGSTNTHMYVKKRNVVISEPTLIVASTSDKHLVRAVGEEAQSLMGRTTDALTAISPVINGMVEDSDSAEVLIRYFMRKSLGVSHLFRPKVLASVPSNLPAVSRKALTEAIQVAGGRKRHIYLVEKPLCSALGAGMQIYEPKGNLVVDIGGGTTDVAVISMGGIVVSQSIPVGSMKMDEAIVNYLKRNSSMLIGAHTAEHLKIDLGSALPPSDNRRVRVRGRDLLSAHPMDVEFTSAQAYEAIKEPCMAILQAIKWVLERTPPELASDISKDDRTGIMLTGGGAQLFGLDRFIAKQLGIPTNIDKNYGQSTIKGLGYMIEDPNLFEGIIRRNVRQ